MSTTVKTKASPIRRRLAALGTAGAIAAGGVTVGLPVVFDASPVSAAEHTGDEQLVPINQFSTGLASADVDCGPTTAVMAMLAEGYTPDNWDPNNHGAAVGAVRDAIGFEGNGYTTFGQVSEAIEGQGVPASTDTDFTGALDGVRDGKTAIVNGYMDSLPYAYNSGNPHIPHWVVVTDYDKDDDTFTVLDSNDGSKRPGTTQAQLETFQASVGDGQSQIVVG